jgi:hypothetical protein
MPQAEPSSAVIISFRRPSKLAGCLFVTSEDCGLPGQTETKSPPGPNLHIGSICLFGFSFILITLLSVIISIGNRGVKTLTKTEQKPGELKKFSASELVI